MGNRKNLCSSHNDTKWMRVDFGFFRKEENAHHAESWQMHQAPVRLNVIPLSMKLYAPIGECYEDVSGMGA